MDGLSQISDFLNTAITCPVDFHDIQASTLCDFLTPRVVQIEIRTRSIAAIQAFGKNTCERGFSRSPRPTEKVGVSDTVFFNGLGQGLGHVTLSDDFLKPLGAVFSCDDLVGRHKELF